MVTYYIYMAAIFTFTSRDISARLKEELNLVMKFKDFVAIKALQPEFREYWIMLTRICQRHDKVLRIRA